MRQLRQPSAKTIKAVDACVQRDPLLKTSHGSQLLLTQRRVLKDRLSMATEHQCQAADKHNEHLQDGATVAGIGRRIQRGPVLRATDQEVGCLTGAPEGFGRSSGHESLNLLLQGRERRTNRIRLIGLRRGETSQRLRSIAYRSLTLCSG